MKVHPPRVVLAVDQATSSGWSLHVGLSPVASGVLNVWHWTARRDVIREATALSPEPFLFAFEDHSQAPLRSYKWTGQVLGLGGALWLWLDSLNRAGHLENMRLGVTSRDWRRSVLGARESLGREECKAQAIRWAEAHTGKSGMGDDEAEAVALGAYAAFAGMGRLEARERMPRPRVVRPRWARAGRR